MREQENKENLPNLSGFDRTIEEWEIEWQRLRRLLGMVSAVVIRMQKFQLTLLFMIDGMIMGI